MVELAALFIEPDVSDADGDCAFFRVAWCACVLAAAHGEEECAAQEMCSCFVRYAVCIEEDVPVNCNWQCFHASCWAVRLGVAPVLACQITVGVWMY